MSPWRSLLLGTLFIVLPLLANAVPDEAERERQLQERGWTIDELEVKGADQPGVRRLTVTGRIAVAAPAVWYAIAYENETSWPGVDQGVVEYQSGDTTIARYKISVPVFRDRRYRLQVVNDDANMREIFHQIPGYGNIRASDGYWQVYPVSDSVSRVDYLLDTDPGVKLVPGFIISWATKRMVPDLYEHIYRDAMTDAAKLESKPE